MSADKIIDPETIENLRMLDDDEDGEDSFLREVIEIFLEDTPQKLTEMRDSFETGNTEVLSRAAHSVKGSSANVGAVKINSIAFDLENSTKDSVEGAGEKIAALEAAFVEARAELEKLLV